MRRTVAVVEARRSRSRAWLMTVALVERWVGKERGCPILDRVPIRESYTGSHPDIEFDRRGLWKVLGPCLATRFQGSVQHTPVGAPVAQILVINHVYSTRFTCIRLCWMNVMSFPWARGRRSRQLLPHCRSSRPRSCRGHPNPYRRSLDGLPVGR
jgi:hypothetical protein